MKAVKTASGNPSNLENPHGKPKCWDEGAVGFYIAFIHMF